jgi:hypothetical protein
MMMKKNIFRISALVAAATLVQSCQKDNDAPAQRPVTVDSVCLVVNMGNYREHNGSPRLYSPAEDRANNVRNNFGAILIDAAVADGVGLVTCNTTDKVEFFDPKAFATLSAPITDVHTPRYIATHSGKAYVSCWGAPDMSTDWWTYPNSYIAEIDLSTKTKTRSISCGSEAEGVYVKGSNLYVAVANGVEVYVLPAVTFSKKITASFTATARQIGEDKNGNIWVSFSSSSGGTVGFAVINSGTLTRKQEVALETLDSYGKFALSKDKSQVLYAAPTVENWVTVSSDIHSINVDSYTVSATPLIRGTSLSTVGVNPWNGDIYTANEDYTGNNTLLIYNSGGGSTPKNEALVGIAPQRFVFY